jgi:hypothetical protein
VAEAAPANEELSGAWSRFVTDVGSFEQWVAIVRTQGAPEGVLAGTPRRFEFPYESARAALESSRVLESALVSLAENSSSPERGAIIDPDSDRDAWRLEEMLLATAAVDASLAVDAFELEQLTRVDPQEFDIPELESRVAGEGVAHGDTLMLLLEAQPLFAGPVSLVTAGARPDGGEEPLGFEHPALDAHFAQAPSTAPTRDIEHAITNLVGESRQTALAFSALPLKALSWSAIQQQLGSWASTPVQAFLEDEERRRASVGFAVSMIRKLLAAVELRNEARLQQVLARIEGQGLRSWFSQSAPGAVDTVLRRLTCADEAIDAVRDSLKDGREYRTWYRQVWEPVLDEVMPRHARSQRTARRVAKAAGLAAPYLNGLLPPWGPAGVIAMAACGIGYSVVNLADRLDADWLGPLGRHQGVVSLVAEYCSSTHPPRRPRGR